MVAQRVGKTAAESRLDFQSLILSCNKDGMDALRSGQHKAAFEQFKYAEAVLLANQSDGDNNSLLAVTCNNLGCYYKKVGKLHGALSYLRRALKMEVELKTDEVTLAGTHLSICAILSKLEKHDKAVQHALCALDLMSKRVSNAYNEKVSQDDYSVLAIAYHNVAVERDILEQYEKAAMAFQQGYQVARRCLGDDHPLSIALGNNCDAVLQKSKKIGKGQIKSSLRGKAEPKFGEKDAVSELPPISGIMSKGPTEDVAAAPPMEVTSQTSAVRQEAANWVASEERAWTDFAQTTLSGGAKVPSPVVPKASAPVTDESSAPRQAQEALLQAQLEGLEVPSLGDQTALRMSSKGLGGSARFGTLNKSRLAEEGFDESPESMLLDADGGKTRTTTRLAPNDFRPNRTIKGSTRTSRMVRRTGMLHSTKHRDEVLQTKLKLGKNDVKSPMVQNMAAEKIQRFWRAWYAYCQENADWMTMTWMAAIIIQSRWRSYHVRRKKLDRAAGIIQRHIRGFLVRKVLKRHQAAVAIQRHIMGALTRMHLARLHKAAIKMQALVRGGQARRRVKKRKAFITKTVVKIQSYFRMRLAYVRVRKLRMERRRVQLREKAATDIQRTIRGLWGRRKAAKQRERVEIANMQAMAATKLQAMVRRDLATKRVDGLRTVRLEVLHKAATLVRKMWLGHMTRRRYQQLHEEFKRHEHKVVVIQRFARGFIVRMRMWREAIRAEEELWACIEIQRIWRGYRGRVKWEAKFEEVWCREKAAATIQRWIRGWVARCKVNRWRRKIARAEFERARKRFRAAQRIQALARGVAVRQITNARRRRKKEAATKIQKIARGHALRKRLWCQVIELRATMIQAWMRGFLVRNRRFNMIAAVICIQRYYRRWLRKPKEHREQAFQDMLRRKKSAGVIQKAHRKRSEKKEVERIQAEDKSKQTQ
eukprot:gnl/TRDRNA2_/TRDRNA2_184176_c0_seq1.p1 gnl/TRDRNA2_/TRDRNA2_184176_c0~~gnl/TRDRNA2_/TRDRNA2_184176_c0_seq1.p1  ORF type:complete len:957 (-),score=221.98 gnl/TRDRNA2_/TRDRNA2_184176_c0_seq1:192-2993(-)